MHSMHCMQSERLPQISASALLTSESPALLDFVFENRTQDEAKVWLTLKSFFREASTELVRTGVPEDKKWILLILGACRWVKATPWREPTIGNVADLCVMNRNSVAHMTDVLKPFGLLSKKQHGRGELVLTTRLGDLYSDLSLENSNSAITYFDLVKKGLKKKSLTSENIEDLELVESALNLVKKSYPENTLNYEVFDTLQHDTIQVIAAIRSGEGKAQALLDKTIEALKIVQETRERAEKLKLKPLVLERTGENVGKGRVYRPVSKE